MAAKYGCVEQLVTSTSVAGWLKARSQVTMIALAGRGPSTFGIVLGITVKIYLEGPVGNAKLSLNRTDKSKFSAAMEAFFKAFDGFVGLNKTEAQLKEMLTPFRAGLDKIGTTYNFSTDHCDTHYDFFKAYNGPLPYGKFPLIVRFNSRIIGRDIVSTSDGISKLTDALQFVVEDTAYGAAWNFVCQAMNVKKVQHADNAVGPHWHPKISDAGPQGSPGRYTGSRHDCASGSGAYLNEADPLLYPLGSTEWKDTFYGSNYDRLLKIKKQVDPHSIFYARTAVGSEGWVEYDDGRLCRA
ncbi:hypothetical protein F4823DRAFT_562658 [Ustulina deusta]|nr:hypothetical protein F4823DRAFT_562658 [Ustulina deusta]